MSASKKWVLVALAGLIAGVTAWAAGAVTKAELTKQLWPKDRIQKTLADIEKVHQEGLMSDEHYRKTKKMLQERLAGTYKPQMLSVTNPPLNFIQNAGFEEINRNSAPNRSRWLWWGGWSWGGNYTNMWEDRKEYVHSGKYSARIECTGAKGRIGISTPGLPAIPGATGYEFTIWAKGTPGNQIFLNFEGDVRGSLRQEVPAQWTQLKLDGRPTGNPKKYQVYIYVTGTGTIWVDDAKLVPVGVDMN